MKQEIWCPDCKEKYPLGKYEGEGNRVIEGGARHDMRCDSCNEEILTGAKCFAVSMYKTGCYLPWEQNYIETT